MRQAKDDEAGGRRAIVAGGGPAGLMAAERLSRAGLAVALHEAMPSVGRKLLMAGRGGLNLTHSEPLDAFLARYGAARTHIEPVVRAFPPQALRDFAHGLGQETFVGSSGRVFPRAMKASPLLRAWTGRLRERGVSVHTRSRWIGWDRQGRPLFRDGEGRERGWPADILVLALGGASWPRLGSDGGWAGTLAAEGIALAPFAPANCGFELAWSAAFAERFAGAALKPLALSFGGRRIRGEAVIADYGLEGGAVYALSSLLREAIAAQGEAILMADLAPGRNEAALAARLAKAKTGQSMANLLRKAAGLAPAAANLLREGAAELPREPEALARRIKALPLRLTAPRPLDRAISSAGGVRFESLDGNLMLKVRPGTFVAGEMLDWEAPTGGYLLQACFATGLAAAEGALRWLDRN